MLEILASAFAGLHIIGAAIGAGGALYAEINYLKSLRGAPSDRLESQWFTITFNTLAWGMFVVLLSSIALTLVQFFIPDGPQHVLGSALWMQHTLAFIIIIAAWFLSRKAFPWWLGSSLVFSGWWMLFALDAWHTEPVPYLTLIFSYVILVFISGALWEYARMLARERTFAV